MGGGTARAGEGVLVGFPTRLNRVQFVRHGAQGFGQLLAGRRGRLRENLEIVGGAAHGTGKEKRRFLRAITPAVAVWICPVSCPRAGGAASTLYR
jgi:hypothetical protein